MIWTNKEKKGESKLKCIVISNRENIGRHRQERNFWCSPQITETAKCETADKETPIYFLQVIIFFTFRKWRVWRNGYHRRQWARQTKFKFWTKLFFLCALIFLGNVCTHFLSIPGINKIVKQTVISSLGRATNQGEGKILNHKTEKCCSGESVIHWCAMFSVTISFQMDSWFYTRLRHSKQIGRVVHFLSFNLINGFHPSSWTNIISFIYTSLQCQISIFGSLRAIVFQQKFGFFIRKEFRIICADKFRLVQLMIVANLLCFWEWRKLLYGLQDRI